MSTTDYTRAAETIRPGDIVNDDQTYDRIVVDQVNPPAQRDENGRVDVESHGTFIGTHQRAGDRVVVSIKGCAS